MAWTVHVYRRSDELHLVLIHAVAKEDARAVQALLAQGADANAGWDYQESRLSFVEFCEQLIGIKPRSLDLRLTVLMEASENGDQAAVKSLLDAGANVNARDSYGYTPLHWATSHSWVHGGPVVELLVAHGADINAKANDGTIIALLANLNADPEVKKALEHATTKK